MLKYNIRVGGDHRLGPQVLLVGGTGWPPDFHWEDPSLAGDGLVEQAEEGSSSLAKRLGVSRTSVIRLLRPKKRP